MLDMLDYQVNPVSVSGSVTIGQVKNINYDIKAQAISAYMAARKTMVPEYALQAAQIFTLSRFYGIIEKLSHDEDFTSVQVRKLMQKKVLEFALILDFDANKFEQVRQTKICNQRQKDKLS